MPRVRFYVMYGQTEATARLSVLPPERLRDKPGSVDVELSDEVLDRIDAIVPPGTNVNPADMGWANPALEPAARRR